MNHDVLETYRQRLEALAAQMEEETSACPTAWIQIEGQHHEAPANAVKGTVEPKLQQPEVRSQLWGIETTECPVVAVGIEFPHQADNLASWYWSWVPMHSVEQRELVRLMASAPVWLVVVFSGEEVSRALVVRVNDIARAQYRQLNQVVESYPTNPRADTERAIDGAQAATAALLGDGHRLETVKDIGGE